MNPQSVSVRKCNKCGGESLTIKTMVLDDGTIIRDRLCKGCRAHWATAEIRLKDVEKQEVPHA